jgi:hypothetical protein
MYTVFSMWWNSCTDNTPECLTFVPLLNIIHPCIKDQNKLYLNKCRNHHCWHRIHSSCRGLELWSTRLHLDIPSLYPWTSQDCTLNNLEQKADSCRSEIIIFWDVTLWSRVDHHQCFGKYSASSSLSYPEDCGSTIFQCW